MDRSKLSKLTLQKSRDEAAGY